MHGYEAVVCPCVFMFDFWNRNLSKVFNGRVSETPDPLSKRPVPAIVSEFGIRVLTSHKAQGGTEWKKMTQTGFEGTVP